MTRITCVDGPLDGLSYDIPHDLTFFDGYTVTEGEAVWQGSQPVDQVADGVPSAKTSKPRNRRATTTDNPSTTSSNGPTPEASASTTSNPGATTPS